VLASISPLGERARGNRWSVTAAAFAVGSTGAAAALGAALGAAFAPVPHPARLAVAASAAIVAGAADLLAPRRVPTWHRQVDEDWLARLRGWVYGVGYGGQLGLGVVTVVTTATVYAWLAAAAMAGSAAAGAVVGATFGAARAMPLLAVRRAESPTALRATLARLVAWAGAGRVAAAVSSVALGGAGWVLVARG
jgi:hypothetical protein